jgi:hypothetical protein
VAPATSRTDQNDRDGLVASGWGADEHPFRGAFKFREGRRKAARNVVMVLIVLDHRSRIDVVNLWDKSSG